MHLSNDLREPVIDAFDYGYPMPSDVVDRLGGPEEARHILGRLWNCSDILPGYIIDFVRLDWPDADRLKKNTFGALSQWMIQFMDK